MSEQTLAQQINLEAAQKNIPLSVFIELTYRCNLACYYCYQRAYAAEKELSLAQWRSVFKQLASMGTLYITLSGGEPFMRDDLLEILASARKNNFTVSLISNGLLITKEWAAGLADLGSMDVGISLHAANALLHDQLSGTLGSFNSSVAAIQVLTAAGVKVLIKHSVSNTNFGEYKALQELADNLGCGFECDCGILPLKHGTYSSFSVTQEQQRTFLRDMGVKPVSYCILKEDLSSLHCDAGRSLCGITPNGDVFPCIILPIFLGNLLEKPFYEIWHSEKAKQFRQDEQTLDEVCVSCELKHVCFRCHGFAYMETGNWRGKSRSLCDRAEAMGRLEK